MGKNWMSLFIKSTVIIIFVATVMFMALMAGVLVTGYRTTARHGLKSVVTRIWDGGSGK